MTSKISSKTESKISCLEISKQRGYPNNPLPEINKSKEKEITLLRAKKIRMLLSPKEQKIFSVWFYVCDYYYNLGIKYYKKNKGINLSSFTFRDLIKKEGNKNKEIRKQIKKFSIPSHVINDYILDVYKAYISAIKAVGSNKCKTKHFRLRYKKHDARRKTIPIPYEKNGNSNYFSRNKLWKNIKFEGNFKVSEINHDCRFQYDRLLGKYYLFVPYDKKCSNEHSNNLIALDPGVRTFLTGVTNNYDFYELNISKKLDKLLSKISKKDRLFRSDKAKTKFKRKINKKISNLVDDFQWKTCKYLCSNFNEILIGKINTISILSKKNNCLSPETKKKLQTLSHYSFRQKLKSKAEEYNNKVYEIDEAYTSMTCFNCKWKNKKLGGNKDFHCDNCGITVSRDFNAAINIREKHFKRF